MIDANFPQPVWACMGCGTSYDPEEVLFLYSDESGSRCRECGSILLGPLIPAVMTGEERAQLLVVSGERIQTGG